MHHGLSDQVRSVAEEKYVHPAIQAGKDHFSIAVRDLMDILHAQGFPARNWPQICTAIQTDKFLRTNNLEIESVEGPPSKQSTTVVVRYRVTGNKTRVLSETTPQRARIPEAREETPDEWAFRVTEKIRGILKDEIAQFGGAEGYIRWVRGYDEEDSE
jgi:hypothetical protein